MDEITINEALEESLQALLAVSHKLEMDPLLDIQVNAAIMSLTKVLGDSGELISS
jgi:indole-3-glycerol phosphate synthase